MDEVEPDEETRVWDRKVIGCRGHEVVRRASRLGDPASVIRILAAWRVFSSQCRSVSVSWRRK